MEVKVENLSNLKRKLTIVVAADEIDQKTTGKLQEVAAKAKIAGFRPGKVPLAVVKQKYGSATRQEVINELLASTYFEALSQEKLNPAGPPSIEPGESRFGEPFKYEATLELYPEFKLTELTGERLEKEVAEVTAADIDKAVTNLYKQHATWEDVSRAAKDGDQLVIDFTGTIKGEAFDGGTAKDFKVELGSGALLADFEKNLQQKRPGDEVKFKLKFPKDYSDDKVAGKKAEFEVKVHKVQEAKLPELNNEFFEKMGIREGGEAKLREKMKLHMERELKSVLEGRFKKAVLDKLLELNPLELPEVMVDEEINHLQQQMKQQFAQITGKKPEELPNQPREHFSKDAERRVHLGLILSEFVKQHELKNTEEELKAKVREMVAGHERPEEFVEWYCADKKRLTAIESVVLESKAIEELFKQVTIIEKKLSYDEAMEQQE